MKAPDSQDIRIRVHGMFTTKGRSWMQLRIKHLPEQMGNILPITARLLRAECSKPTGAKRVLFLACNSRDRVFFF